VSRGYQTTGRRVPFVFLVLLLLGAVTPGGLPAQETGPPKDGPTPPPAAKPLTGETIEGLKKSAEQIKDEKLKERVLGIITEAEKQLNAAAAFEKEQQAYEAIWKNAPQDKQNAAAELETLDQPAPLPNAEKLSREELERRLSQAETQNDTAEKNATLLETRKTEWQSGQEKASTRLAKALEELKQLKESMIQPGEPKEVIEAETVRRQARQLALDNEIAALNSKLKAYKNPVVGEALDLQIKVAKLRAERADAAAKFWKQKIEDRRRNEALNQLDDATILLRNLKNADMPAELIKLAEENLEYVEERTGPEGTVARIRATVDETNKVEEAIKKLADSRQDVDEKLKIPEIEDVLGRLLLYQRRKLPDVDQYERRLRSRNRDASHVRLKRITYERQSARLTNLQPQIDSLADRLKRERVFSPPVNHRGQIQKPDAARRAQIEAFAAQVLTQRKQIIDALSADYNTLYQNLLNLSVKDRSLIQKTTDFRRLIDKHILWIPTTEPLGPEHWKEIKEASQWLITREHWKEVGRVTVDALIDSPVISALAVFLLALGLLKQRPMKRRLVAIGEEASRGFTQPFTLTLQAILLTVVLSVLWPAVLLFLGWQLTFYPETTEFASSVGTALHITAVSLLTLDFLRRTFRTRGLGGAHFRWKDVRMQRIRRHLHWFAAVVIPGVFIFTLIKEYGDYGGEDYIRSLGRVVLMGLLLVCSIFLAVVLRNPQVRIPFSEVFGHDHTVATKPASVTQLVGYLAVVLFPVALAILAAVGYQYTATFLTWKLLCTAWLGVVLLVIHATAIRWLYYARGKLALEFAQQAAEAKAKEHPAETPPEQPAEESPAAGDAAVTESAERADAAEQEETPQEPAAVEPPPSTDLATINAQTRRLLRIAIGGAAVLGVWMIWLDVLPALKFLETPFWSTQVETTKTVPGPNNTTVTEPVTQLKSITLGDVLLAVGVLVIVFVAAANIPGLLEVAVLQKLPIDSGARYAASTMARYVIYIIGIVAAFNLIGLGWGKVQWLVAALGVGLGFGLQEIFANFVSGIILLFERPLRVGDIVTVGDVSGTVTRIQIRATTIRNWDRQEYIVPNKELVTGKLLNWTLSDSINRVVVNVGVAYGTDAEKVRSVLLEVLANDSEVLDDPAPLVTMEGFGDSSLNFVVRCYLPSLANRLNTVHRLHASIQSAFKAAGIEIPFPQRDLHIRSDATRGKAGQSNGQDESQPSSEELDAASVS